jgi:hypothetical protein
MSFVMLVFILGLLLAKYTAPYIGKLVLTMCRGILDPTQKNAKVNCGNRTLLAMMKAGLFSRVSTFNFDAVWDRAAIIDTVYRAIYDYVVSRRSADRKRRAPTAIEISHELCPIF